MCDLQDFNNLVTPIATIGTAILLYKSFMKQADQTRISKEQNYFQQLRSAIDQWSKSRAEFKVFISKGNGEFSEYTGYEAINMLGKDFLGIAHLNYYNYNNNAFAVEFSLLVQRLDQLHEMLNRAKLENDARKVFRLEIDHYTRVVCRAILDLLERRKSSTPVQEDKNQDYTFMVFHNFYEKYKQVLKLPE